MKKHVIEIFQKKKEIATPDETKFIFRSLDFPTFLGENIYSI